MTDVAARTESLTKTYGSVRALDGLDLEVPLGSTFGLIGPNGAGKSTTFAILASLLSPTSGRVEVAGIDPAVRPLELRRQVGYMPDVVGVYENLRVDEYLRFFAGAYRIAPATWSGLVDGLLELVDLGDKRDAMVDSLSRGMKQRLSLARALVHDPTVLILDEPASGLDPRARVDLRDLLNELRAMGKTIIVSSHVLSELEEMCTHVAILDAGRVLVAGSPRDLRTSLSPGRKVLVRTTGGEEHSYSVADEGEQVELIRRLVAEGMPITEVVETDSGLEDLFLRITERDAQ